MAATHPGLPGGGGGGRGELRRLQRNTWQKGGGKGLHEGPRYVQRQCEDGAGVGIPAGLRLRRALGGPRLLRRHHQGERAGGREGRLLRVSTLV